MGVGYIKMGAAKTWGIDKILEANERDVFQAFVKLFVTDFSCVGLLLAHDSRTCHSPWVNYRAPD
jgi:hypothetical protein